MKRHPRIRTTLVAVSEDEAWALLKLFINLSDAFSNIPPKRASEFRQQSRTRMTIDVISGGRGNRAIFRSAQMKPRGARQGLADRPSAPTAADDAPPRSFDLRTPSAAMKIRFGRSRRNTDMTSSVKCGRLKIRKRTGSSKPMDYTRRYPIGALNALMREFLSAKFLNRPNGRFTKFIFGFPVSAPLRPLICIEKNPFSRHIFWQRSSITSPSMFVKDNSTGREASQRRVANPCECLFRGARASAGNSSPLDRIREVRTVRQKFSE